MISEPRPVVESEPEPARNDELVPSTRKAVAEANTREYVESNARIDKRDVRMLFRRMADADQRRFLAEVIGVDDIVAWRMSALDLQRRQIADAVQRYRFRSMTSGSNIRGRARVWIAEYERSEQA